MFYAQYVDTTFLTQDTYTQIECFITLTCLFSFDIDSNPIKPLNEILLHSISLPFLFDEGHELLQYLR